MTDGNKGIAVLAQSRGEARPEVIWLIWLWRATALLCFLTDCYLLKAFSYLVILTLQFSQTMKLFPSPFCWKDVQRLSPSKSLKLFLTHPPSSQMGKCDGSSAVVFKVCYTLCPLGLIKTLLKRLLVKYVMFSKHFLSSCLWITARQTTINLPHVEKEE